MSDFHECEVCPCSIPAGTHCPCLHRLTKMTDATPALEQQTWERRVADTDVAEMRLHLQVDADGRVRVHEAVLCQLLLDNGWERTS